MRIYAEDVSGVMAEITNVLAKESISIEAVTQHEPTDVNSLIPIVMITNSVEFSSIKKDIINLVKKVDDDVTLIKLKEVIKQMPTKSQTKSMVRDKQVASLLRHYELVKELKKI